MRKISKKNLNEFNNSVYAFIKNRFNPVKKEDEDNIYYEIETHYGKARLTLRKTDQIGYNVFTRFNKPNKHTSTYSGKYNLHAGDDLNEACSFAYHYLDILSY